MSSIYIKAASFLHRHSTAYGKGDLPFSIPVLVCHRGLFDCMAPRIEQILTQRRDGTANSSLAAFLASNACTYHLTRKAFFAVRSDQDVRGTAAAMRKLTQVAVLTLARDFSDRANIAPVCAELKRFAPTLTALDVTEFVYNRSVVRELAPAIAELRNVTELGVPLLTPAMCNAIAAGPGARLHELKVRRVECATADLDALVAGCPNIWALRLGDQEFDFVLAASKLPYLQSLKAGIIGSPSENDVCAAFSNMVRVTRLDLCFHRRELSNAEATSIATTIGPHLLELTLELGSHPLSSDVFATLCCASSFPQLEVLSLHCYGTGVIEHDVTVSLAPSLLELRLNSIEIAPRTLTQLLSDKPRLRVVVLHLAGLLLVLNGNNSNNNTNVEDDWFGQLVKSPVRKLTAVGKHLPAAMDTRIALLAPTLSDVIINVGGEWPATPRDEFLGTLFSRCVLLERCLLRGADSSSAHAIDSRVAFAGLRNNERLRSIEVQCKLSSLDPLIDELLAMRSNDLRNLVIDDGVIALSQGVALAQRFVHLESVSRFENNFPPLERRFPHVKWVGFVFGSM